MNSAPLSPLPQQPSQPGLREKLAQAHRDEQKWRAIAANPALSPQAAVAAQEAARSSAAAVRLGQKAAAYQAGQNGAEAADDPWLDRLLGLNSSPPSQPIPSLSPGQLTP